MEDLLAQGFGYFPSLIAYQKCCSECSEAGGAISKFLKLEQQLDIFLLGLYLHILLVGRLWISLFLAADRRESRRFFNSLKDFNGETESRGSSVQLSVFLLVRITVTSKC